MANKSVFSTCVGKLLGRTDTINHQGARAYALTPEQALAQLAMTGTFNATFYADAGRQLDDVLALAWQVEPDYLARIAVHAFEQGHMKDMPALLLAVLASIHGNAFERAFPRIVRNGKMLRNFVQIMRSGATGRKSLGTRPKRLVQNWLDQAQDIDILRAAIGNAPSLADVIRMVHPKPKSAAREALYGYLIGRPHDYALLPDAVKEFEAFRRDPSLPVPAVPFQMLTSLPLTKEHWAEIARTAGWQMLRQNLNTFARHGVFGIEGFAESLARRLGDAGEIRRARVFPYQLMVTYRNSDEAVPAVVRDALHDAMEIALANVPAISGNVVICPDVSGSMGSPVTGYRKGATSSVRCIDVAALVAAALLRRNPAARVLPFEEKLVKVMLDPRDTVMTNAGKLAMIGGGGTNCSAPLQQLVKERARVDLVVFVSDNQSWVDARKQAHAGTGMMENWGILKARNPQAKLVCIDIQPYADTQAKAARDVLNIGGFSDHVFDVIASMMASEGDPDQMVRAIDAMEL